MPIGWPAREPRSPSLLCLSKSGYTVANSLFHHQPSSGTRPNSKPEAAYQKADASIRNIIQLLETA
jgi:hypothetical protein